MKTRHEILMEDPEYRRLYAIEGLVADAAEMVARLMEEKCVTKAELARRLGKSRAWVTQLLSGRANMTIRTLAEVAYALGAEVNLSTEVARVQLQPTSQAPWNDVFDMPFPEILWEKRHEVRFDVPGHAPSILPTASEIKALERLEYAA